MKKYILPIVLFGIFIISFFININKVKREVIIPPEEVIVESKATLSIDFGEEIVKTFDLTLGLDDTAFSVLKKTCENENINLEIQQYDFGVFVKKIDDFESTVDKSWIYFVNGTSGNVAADQYILNPDDVIEWKYIQPISE